MRSVKTIHVISAHAEGDVGDVIVGGVAQGDKVIAGSINGEGSLKIQVSHGTKDSYLSQVIKLVQDALDAKSKTQLLADQAAKWLTIIALLSGTATFIVWLVIGKDLAFAMERMVTVIVICSPHALGLAVPLVVARSTAISAQSGLLIKDRTAFENSRKLSMLVFDKTDTLTKGEFNVVSYEGLDGKSDKEQVLQLAAALEQNSEHPIATGPRPPGTVMFGGTTSRGVNADTWTYTGNQWSLITPQNTPPGRSGHAIASDTARNVVLMFGGSGVGSDLNDTWEWDGTNWNARATGGPSPSIRSGHAMTWNANAGRLIVTDWLPRSCCHSERAIDAACEGCCNRGEE